MSHEYHWQREPQAELLLQEVIQQALSRNSFLRKLQDKLSSQCNTRLFDWIDHIEMAASDELEKKIKAAGFVAVEDHFFHHPGAQLPSIVIKPQGASGYAVAISVDSIAYFQMVHGLCCLIEGTPLSGYRRSIVSREGDVEVMVIERRGSRSREPLITSPDTLATIYRLYEKWQLRPRHADTLDEEIAHIRQAIVIAEEMVACVGTGMAAHIVLDVERAFWQSKNYAGQIQKSRQDRVGMGWANHDHHTFRSSRCHFQQIIHLFEILGFTCRERFYAGKEAGWGAQVMEHTIARFVLFIDVDLAEDEVNVDFAHDTLPPRSQLGTIGLWCGLHGESLLAAGMHHLEAQFSFHDLEKALAGLGVQMMAPFSNFSYLKQAFTKAEIWPVSHTRLERLLKNNSITQEQASRFMKEGALGSHLENLQRQEGFKGFNQKNVSAIIHDTDPRGSVAGA